MAGLFSFGKSSSKNQSQSTSVGGSSSFGVSGGQQGSFGQQFGQSFIDQSQQPFLDFLRNTAQGGFGASQQFGQGVQQAFGGLGQQAGALGALGGNNPFLGLLQQQAGGNPDLVAAQTGQLSQDLSNQFNEQINPAISRQATGLGQLGGGRQGVAQGAAIQGQQRALASGAVGFQAADAARAQQAGIAGGQLFGQGINQGLQALGQQGQFLQGAQQAGFNPLQQLAQLFGAPTVLSQSGGFDTSFGQQFGFDQASAFNQAQSTSSGKSSGFNFGIGGS